MPLFQPKHQKLILQCYPAGRGFDKKPNSSELSYLLYYASTRRVKLEKVGRFLERKNGVDVARNRTGNVQVTLDILEALMEKCPDDLNVFAANVVAVLQSVVGANDLGLAQHAEPVFATLCRTLDLELFTGDETFVHSFQRLASGFIRLGSRHAGETNRTEWEAVSLKACAGFGHCRALANGFGKGLVAEIMPLTVCELQETNEDKLLSRIQSHQSEHDLSRRASMSPSNANTTANANSTNHIADEPSTPKEINTEELAMEALKALFHTSSTSKISVAARAMVQYLAKSKHNSHWAAVVIELMTNWVPVQLRFMILSILIGQLNYKDELSEQLCYLTMISTLLSSSVNLIGLSIIDHLRQLVNLQMQSLRESKPKNLVLAYSEAIGSLGTHIYYQDQIVDLISELLIRLDDCYKSKKSNSQTITLVLLDNIKNILITTNNHTTVQRTKVPLEIFSNTFNLISCYNCSSLPIDIRSLIQSKYIDVLITDLELEYSDQVDYNQPDHNNLISDAKASVINQLYEEIEKFANIQNSSNFLSMLKLIELITSKFGINCIVNSLPFLFEWQLTEQSISDKDAVIKDNFGHFIVYYAAKNLHYDDIFQQVLSRIDYRRQNNIWIINTELPLESSSLPPKSSFSKDEFNEFFQHELLDRYRETILQTHYRYNNSNKNVLLGEGEEEFQDANETSFISTNGDRGINHNDPLALLLQPNKSFNDNNSIKSAPLSARSLMMGKLSVPKVQELRKAISGASLKITPNDSNISRQRTDVHTLLHDLNLNNDLEDRGSLTIR